MNEKDNIKIDISNIHSDIQKYTREYIDKITIYDENQKKSNKRNK